MDENEGPTIVCFTCHARLIRCRRLQQQAIEANAVLEQLLEGGSTSIPKPHEGRDEIKFTPICHIDIWPVECDIGNDCKDEIFSLDSIKIEEENFENENSKFERNGNCETDPAGKGEDLKIDAFGDIHMDSGNDLALIAFESKSKENSKTIKLKKERENNKKDDDDIEQYITPSNNFSEPSEKNIKSNSTDRNINDVHEKYLDFESSTIKSNPKLKNPAKIMKKKNLKQKSVNILTKKTSTKYIFECDGCSKKFSTKHILAKHISYSDKTQKNSDTTAVRTQVEQTPVPQLTEIFNYDICEFKTSQKRQVYCCNNCDYKCTNKSKLLYHMKLHTVEKPFSCNICDYQFIQKSNLRRHIKIHTGEKPFSCNICEYKCIRKGTLHRHMKTHTGEKSFSCNICEYKCTRNTDLKQHMKIHAGEKPFSCNTCEYKCVTKCNLQRHMKIHTGEKPFSCHICEYKCILEANLRRHIKIHTGEKPFSCHICEYKCLTNSRLQTHIKIHTGEKPFSCNICEYRCIRKSHLQTHMKIHTRDKPFSCNICEYRCIKKRDLQKHMKIHTGAKPLS
ncbi:unnamed protein product [Parnassius mnemosyne]|uniref:C2H2-type domain-containing protein n=2 Tax=Parnassius mnemosyne TaxID=213953 RepID=A0AAV1LAZ9_9NEOP